MIPRVRSKILRRALVASILVHLGILVCGIYLAPTKTLKEEDKPLEFIQVSAFISAAPPPPASKATPPRKPAPPPPQESKAAITIPENEPEPDPKPQADPEPETKPEVEPQPEAKPEPEATLDTNAEAESQNSNQNSNLNQNSPVQSKQKTGSEQIFLPSIRVDTLPTYRKKANLEYPDQARRQNKEGRVIVEADIDEEGHIVATRVLLKAGFGFDEAAQDMIRSSEFSPALVKGKAVAVRMRFTLDFKLKAVAK